MQQKQRAEPTFIIVLDLSNFTFGGAIIYWYDSPKLGQIADRRLPHADRLSSVVLLIRLSQEETQILIGINCEW